ncbi:hypothetical protein Ae201684P_010835 [Aphanomyces euteiches]|nr:hypothetical protein Ae201684P_010835 [Aphanomyces euteiches]
MVSYADRRRDSARKGMAKLRAARKREMEILMAQEQNLQVALEYLKAHPEEQHQSIQPFAYARRVLDQHHDDALREQSMPILKTWPRRGGLTWLNPIPWSRHYREVRGSH